VAVRCHKLNIHSGFSMPRPRLDHVRKAQILTAAASVLSERGYANARVVDIAKAAGTSPAAILYWFDGKQGLLAEALALREMEFHERYTARIEDAASVSQRLRMLVEAMLRHYDWALWMELCVLALRDPSAAAERDRMDRRWRSMLRKVIRDGQQRGEFVASDPDETMFVLAALLDGMAPLLAMKAKGVTLAHVERVWLAEAARLLGTGFDASPLERTR
jgi:AcrR family transcriptional regulator